MTRRLVGIAAVAALATGGLVGCDSDQDAYCAAVADHQEELSEIVGSGGPDALLRALDVFRDLQDRAPADVSAEWERVVGSIEALRDALDQAGVDATTYDRDDPPAGLSDTERTAIDAAATRLGSAETARSLRDLDQQARDVCHTPLTL